MGLLAVGALLAGALTGVAPAAASAKAPKLQRAMDELVAAGVPGVVVVARHGDRTTRLASGSRNLATQAPFRLKDRFRIASLTKSFIATVVLQLAGEGKLSLDDSVEHWLPGVVPNGENITVAHLLGHRSGLFDYIADPRVLEPYLNGNTAYYWAPLKLVEVANSHEPLFAPGTTVSYSNTGYVLMGLIIKAATGNTVREELTHRIFKPLGLHATTFDISGHIAGPHAHGYLVVPGQGLQDVTRVSPSYYWTAGNIVSTAGDVARFYRALFAGRLLAPDLLQTMQGTGADENGVQMGLGLFAGPTPCGTAWGHDGAAPGYNATAYISEDGRRQVVALVNSVTFEDKVGSPKAQRAFSRLVNMAFCG